MKEKNNSWFRRRRGLASKDLGWGYTPINAKGWVVILIYIIAVLYAAFVL